MAHETREFSGYVFGRFSPGICSGAAHSCPGFMSAILEVHDLKRVVGDRTILTDINFSVRAGEILFIRGPSGVGKSLLLRALAYLDPIQVAHAFPCTFLLHVLEIKVFDSTAYNRNILHISRMSRL